MAQNVATVTTTELVRNLSAIIDEVRISGQPLSITKGTQTVAELRPPTKPGIPLTKLAALLASLPKLGKEEKTMAQDLLTLRRKASLPKSPWG